MPKMSVRWEPTCGPRPNRPPPSYTFSLPQMSFSTVYLTLPQESLTSFLSTTSPSKWGTQLLDQRPCDGILPRLTQEGRTSVGRTSGLSKQYAEFQGVSGVKVAGAVHCGSSANVG